MITRPDRLETLNEISRVVSSTLDLGRLYDTIYRQIGRVMDTSQFFIALRGNKIDALDIPYLVEEGKMYVDVEAPLGANTTTAVINEGLAFVYRTSEEYYQFERTHGFESIIVGESDSESGIFVPLSIGNQTIGAMTVQSMRPYSYNEEDLQTLTVIASQAAVAIENARLYARSQDAVRQMQALLSVARTISSSLDLQTVLDSILAGMHQVVTYDMAAVLLPDFEAQRLDIVSSTGYMAEERRKTVKVPFGQGVTGDVFITGNPLVVRDVSTFPGFIGSWDAIRSEMAVPLKRGEAVIGVLDVERTDVAAFSDEDLNLLLLFASQAAIAIENARLYAAQQERVDELSTIERIVHEIAPLHDMKAIAGAIERGMRGLIDFHSLRLFLLDGNGELLPLLGDQPEMRFRIGQGITGWIAAHGQSVIIDNLLADPRSTHIPGTPIRPESMIGTALVYEGRVRGVITLTKLGTGQFDENALRLLEIIAAQGAIAFDRARLYSELRQEAVTDPLTGLYNRRYLVERYKEEVARATRNRHELVAIMLDIDKFKRVNDEHGHDAGDVVLIELGSVIRRVVRQEDIVARYGGEEFCILVPETPMDDAAGMAERLRRAIASEVLPAAAGTRQVTVSVGMAAMLPSDREQEVFTRADAAMYAVKRQGGNHTCIALDDGEFRCLWGGAELGLPDVSFTAPLNGKDAAL